MKPTMKEKIFLTGLLTVIIIIMTQCTTAPEWQKKNAELIKQNALTIRQIPDYPAKT